MKRALFVGLAVLSACITVQPRVELPRRSTPEPTPVAGDERLNAVLWMQTGAEYRASAMQAFQVAQRMLDRALADPTWTAVENQASTDASTLPPAVIVDIDETVLDNSPFEARQIRAGQSFSEEVWKQWVLEAKAEPIPGALLFTKDAAARGVTVFYVSGRQADQEQATRANLARHGFPLDPTIDTVLLRGERPEWGSDKASRRVAVGSRYRVLLLIGDDLGDFTSEARGSLEQRRQAVDRAAALWGTKWIMLPNAMYGSWERAIVATEPDLTPVERLRRKIQKLNAAL